MAAIDREMDNFDFVKTPLAPPSAFLAAHIKRGRYLFLDMKKAAERLAIVCAGWEECHTAFDINRPAFKYVAFELLAGGEWEVRTARRLKRCGPGWVLIYGPDSPCSIRAVGKGPHFKYFVDLRPEQAGELLRGAGVKIGSAFFCRDNASLVELLEQIISCSTMRESMRTPVACALTRALLLRAAGAHRSHVPDPVAGTTFAKCRHHLESHYEHIENIRSAAAACHITPEHFSRLFRRFTGMTAERFLAVLRVNHATRLLEQSPLSVKEIAAHVGLKDPYHFSRLFRKLSGRSPIQVRKKQAPPTGLAGTICRASDTPRPQLRKHRAK